jgi:hypothetical protein
MTPPKPRTGYYGEVTQRNNKIFFRMRVRNLADVERRINGIVDTIRIETGFSLALDSGAYDKHNPPNLNVCSLYRSGSPVVGEGLTFRWECSEASDNHNTKFVSALKLLIKIFAEFGFIDAEKTSAKKLIGEIIASREKSTTMQVGSKTYKVTFEEQNKEQLTLDQEVLEAFQTELEHLNSAMELKVSDIERSYKEELDRIKSDDTRPYNITQSDFVEGFFSFVDSKKMVNLAYPFTWDPKYITYGNITYEIKPGIIKKVPGYIIYVRETGNIYFAHLKKDKLYIIKTPHTRSEGKMCTGSVESRPKLSLEEAKKIILRMAEASEIVALDNTTTHEIVMADESTVYMDTNFLDKYTEKVTSKKSQAKSSGASIESITTDSTMATPESAPATPAVTPASLTFKVGAVI